MISGFPNPVLPALVAIESTFEEIVNTHKLLNAN
jgi:hypothetical protein